MNAAKSTMLPGGRGKYGRRAVDRVMTVENVIAICRVCVGDPAGIPAQVGDEIDPERLSYTDVVAGARRQRRQRRRQSPWC